ncbi:MAG: AbrB/MazE/SpoVT family DNA-binding domain-containing protein [Candidatus Thermoplasmatota archaeon]|nr:AbrB/MazE/SpoVT family DNA-binding domain-containing protein [Candidatus Thermoplasmatota archaeon]
MDEPFIVTAYQQKTDGALAFIIPKAIRQKEGITKGMKFIVFVSERKIIYKPYQASTKHNPSSPPNSTRLRE